MTLISSKVLRSRGGFTILESLVVLGVLAIMTILIFGLIRLNLAPEKDMGSPDSMETGTNQIGELPFMVCRTGVEFSQGVA